MNIRTLDSIKDEFYGKVGTQERDRLERELKALRVGLKIREARQRLYDKSRRLYDKI